MEYRRLGSSGLMVSVLGLGCNNFGTRLGVEDSHPIIRAALDAGVTLFDTAESYGSSEEILGKLLKGNRDEVVIATKFGYPPEGVRSADNPMRGGRGGRRYIRHAIERSLRRLDTDWIDLYQLHEPDPATPIAETLEALTELVTEGKVRYIGSSNFSAWQVTDADWTGRRGGLQRFISAQNEYSLLARSPEVELIPAIALLGIGLLPYFPLACGLLAGRYRRGETPSSTSGLTAWGFEGLLTDETFDSVERLETLGAELGRTVLDLAIGGLAAQPTVASVIPGASSVEQLRANVKAATWTPDPAEREAIQAARPVPSRGFSVTGASA
jgi:aryl-alcohol dehydrogenase-like predicted oxidoreductase